MNLLETNYEYIKENIEKISKELSQYENISRSDLLNMCINNKLKNVLKKYCREIDLTSDFLIKRESIRVLKTMMRIEKENDKDVILENLKEKN